MKKLLFLFAGCLLFAGANAQGLEDYNEWFTDGANALALETEEMDGYNVAKVVVPEGGADSWNVQFCNIFTGNTGQELGNSFQISFDVYFEASSDDVETSNIMIFTGKNYGYFNDLDEYVYDHGNDNMLFDNTELYDDEDNRMQFIEKEVTNGEWTTITLAGTIGESGEDYIGLQFNLSSYTLDEVSNNNGGNFYFRNIEVAFDGSTQLEYYGELEDPAPVVTNVTIQNWEALRVTSATIDDKNTVTISKLATSNTWDCQFNPPTWIAPSKGRNEAFEFSFDAKYEGEGTDGDETGYITFIHGRQFASFTGDNDDYEELCDELGIDYVYYAWGVQSAIEQMYVDDYTGAPWDFYGDNLLRNVKFYPTDEWQHFSFSGNLGRHAVDSVDISMEFGAMAGNYSIKNVVFTVKGNEFASYFVEPTPETNDGTLHYEVYDNEAVVTNLTDANATTVTIPSTITIDGVEYPVTTIGNGAFANSESLTTINIPASVQNIGEDPFENCNSLTTITVDNANNYWSAVDGVLFNKNKTLLIYCPAGKTGKYTVPNTVTEIGNNAFSNCTQIEEVILPAGLQTIGLSAFWNCQSMSSIVIPESVTVLKEGAFGNCDNTLTINCEASSAQSGWQTYWNGFDGGCKVNWAYGAWSLSEDGVLTISKNINHGDETDYPWYSVRDNITSVVVEDGVTLIGYRAFYEYYNLENVTLPNSITEIKANAFYDCDNLNYRYDENDVSYLGNEDNPYLCLINRPAHVVLVTVNNDCKTIADYALSYANRVDVPETVEYIGENAFNNAEVVYYTGSATGNPWGARLVNPVYDGDFIFADEEQTILVGYNGNDTEIVIPSTVTEIGEGVFRYMTDMTSVEFPEGLTIIGENAFYYCTSLTTIELPSTVTTIDDGAFAHCESLASAELPSSVTYIGDNAFENCALTSVTIPESVEYIGNYAFSSCNELETIDLSEATSLETIGGYAFRWCYQLQTVDMTNATSLESIGSYAFSGCSSLEKVIIPASVTYVDELVFSYCSDNLLILCESDWSTIDNWNYAWNYDENYNSIAYISNYKNIYVNVYSSTYGYGTVTGSGTYEYGTEVTITATANEGYQFLRWADGELNSTRTIIVNEGYLQYQAIFADDEATTYMVTLNVNNANYGSVYGSGKYTEGYYEIFASHADNCHFVQWSDGSTSESRTLYVNDDVTLTAEFAINTYTVNIYAPDDGGTTEGAETGTYDYGTELTVTAVPDEGYKFVYWDGDYPTLRNPLTFTVTSYDWWKPVFTELCKEVFEGENTILASGVVEEDNCYFVPDETAEYRIFSSTEYTKISVLDADKNIIATASGWNWNGFNLNIELTAGETYYFAVGFMGDVTREISLEIRKSLNVTLTAENGTVRGAGSYPYGSYVNIQAVADEGYNFVRWSDGVTDEYRGFNIHEDIELEAIFAPEDLNIYYIDAWGTVDGYYPSGGYVMGESSYAEGETVTLTAVPNVGNKFSQWRDGNTDNPRTITVTGDAEYIAEFEQIYYTITKVAENGTITGGDSYYWYGQNVIIKAVPNDYCSFAGWADMPYYFGTQRYLTVTSDTTITAYFEAQLFDVTAESANPAQGSVEGSGAYAYGSEVTLKATGATGYHFVEWSDGETDNPRTVTVNDYNNSYTAYFEINTYNVIADANLENGSITGIGTYTHGQEATFKAVPVGGYKFVRWSNLGTEDEFTTTVTGDMTLSAVFCEDSKDVFEVTVKTAGGRGTVTGASMYVDGEKATFTASPDEGYHFTYWNDDKDATEPTLKKTITKEQTITAHFEKNTYAVAISAGENGTVAAKLDGKDFVTGTVEHGEEITLKATANANYHFAGWSDGNNDAERTISVTKDLNLTANFAKDTYTLSIKATNGTIKGNGTFEIGESVTITAEPAFGYKFVRWSDGNTDNPRTVTITVELINTIDESFTAVFEEAGNATAIEDEVAAEINIYAYGNTIVVENATSDIDVYSAMGQLVSRTTANGERNVITVNGTGIYIVRTGNVAKRVMLQ